MSKKGHRPQRTCLGCGARDEQSCMLRLTAPQPNWLKINRQSRGRGGYLHPMDACWQAFLKRKSVYRAFHLEISREAKEDLVRTLRESRQQSLD